MTEIVSNYPELNQFVETEEYMFKKTAFLEHLEYMKKSLSGPEQEIKDLSDLVNFLILGIENDDPKDDENLKKSFETYSQLYSTLINVQ